MRLNQPCKGKNIESPNETCDEFPMNNVDYVGDKKSAALLDP